MPDYFILSSKQDKEAELKMFRRQVMFDELAERIETGKKIKEYVLGNFQGNSDLMKEKEELVVDKELVINYFEEELEKLSETEDEFFKIYYGVDEFQDINNHESIPMDEYQKIKNEIKENLEILIGDRKYFHYTSLDEEFLLKSSEYLLNQLL